MENKNSFLNINLNKIISQTWGNITPEKYDIPDEEEI
jgi:hypothetical protein